MRVLWICGIPVCPPQTKGCVSEELWAREGRTKGKMCEDALTSEGEAPTPVSERSPSLARCDLIIYDCSDANGGCDIT